MNTLEQQLSDAFIDLEVSERQQASIQTYLQLIKNKDLATYSHSIRVGLKGIELSNLFGLDPKILFYAGLLHDVGKSLTDINTLKKTVGFDDKDMDDIVKHPKDGYRLLKGIHDFSAEIIIRHHKFHGRQYPKMIPKSEITFSAGNRAMIDYYSRLLSLIDFYDAISYRKNDKFEEGTDKKKVFIDNNRELEHMIINLYEAKIFS